MNYLHNHSNVWGQKSMLIIAHSAGINHIKCDRKDFLFIKYLKKKKIKQLFCSKKTKTLPE